jgi:Integral peroxisomal membrane peroxin
MDEYTADAFVNRDEPLPLISVTADDVLDSPSDADVPGKRPRLKETLSASRLKEKAQNNASSKAESFQDRLFAKLLERVIPTEDIEDGTSTGPTRGSSAYLSRPAFSLPIMTNNFRRFNARIGIVFVFQNRMIRLFAWEKATHTLSFLAVFTLLCLDPYLLVVLPLAVCLLFIMVPAFISRHPPPPPTGSTSSTVSYYEYTGPALAPASTIRPASETSKDFFRNMRDLQNSMADFSTGHDLMVSLIAPPTNFSDEFLSSTIFLYLTIITTSLFIAAKLIPWRLIFLVGGWFAICSGHPTAQFYLAKMQRSASMQIKTIDNADISISAPAYTTVFKVVPLPTYSTLKSWFKECSAMTLDTSPETREVEIFELQHKPLHSSTVEWQPHMFTPTPYDPLSPSRISGSRPRGTRFFEDVQPPSGWAWDSKKWTMDILPGEWVSERLVVGVEYDADFSDHAGSGEGSEHRGNEGWVWDLPPKGREEEVWLAYGEDYGLTQKEKKESEKTKKHQKKDSDWEEGARWSEGSLKTGEWRRRRWVRTVKRVSLSGAEKEDGVI